ncbi:hypothetical protein [Candidatus Ruminimicrobiellum ovillum]|uniref:hypothetical protein n=1 Tax=Candidatus Ruminimicrobiellum ovillum TaxID=1947927 RepID=UPI003559744B
MEENVKQECPTDSKKCCSKCIIIVIVCSLLCFFIGYYAGTKSLAKVSGAAINRPFNSRNIPRTPPRIPNIPKIQNPRVQRPPVTNIPNIQRPPVSPQGQAPKVNIPDSVKEKAAAQAKNNTAQKK